MSLLQLLFGRPIASEDAEEEKLGALAGIPVLGLDALASASYGPEAALTVLIPLGAAGLGYIGPLMAVIVGVLLMVQFSYRQTIAAYPDGGGSYTVAKENLGTLLGLLAAAALFFDYVLNVAVAISAGVGALCSTFPPLLPHTVPLCLGILLLLMMVNLRGLRSAGLAFMLPTYLFVGCLAALIALGLARALLGGGGPHPVVAPPPLAPAAAGASLWLLVHAFANGCTAMTGVEAVSNAVPVFREPKVDIARRTLSAIIVLLALLLLGLAALCRLYHVGATEPGQPGFQSVISQLAAAVAGRGVFYYITMGAVIGVLCLSANTSFADFPRLCRMLALDEFFPAGYAHQGRRLVFGQGIVLLAVLATALLVLFRGVTDRLIPLFAVGALSAFTLSQAGMVAHWRRVGGEHALRSQLVNGAGAVVTGVTLLTVVVAKFSEGAWLALLFVPLLVAVFLRMRRYYEQVAREVEADEPLDVSGLQSPVVVVPLRRLDRITRKALRFALTISADVYAVQVLTERHDVDDLAGRWAELVEAPSRAAGLAPPRLVVQGSAYRDLVEPFFRCLRRLAKECPERPIAVLVPELVQRRWYHFLLHTHVATMLKLALLWRGGPRVVIINAPWYLRD